MIKYYCDWCNVETKNPRGGKFGRRVGLSLSGTALTRMNVCFEFEFTEPKPEHLCSECYIRKIEEAVKALKAESNG